MTEGSGGVQAGSHEALGDRAKRGAVVLTAAQAIKFATQMLSTVVLARLLSPHDVGVFAMVMPLVGFVMLFQDLGLSQAVVSVRGVSRAQETTLFSINLGLSVALAVLFAAASPLLARFYGTDEVVGPVLVLAGTVVLSGLATLQFALLVRDLDFTAMAVADIAGAVTGVAAAIAVALVRPSAWALVASVVANMTIGLVCGWRATGWRPIRPAPLAQVRHLLTFGRGVVGASFATFVTRNADNVLIARYLGAVPLGYYDRGYKLLLLPLQQVVSPLGRVTVPILARLADAPDRYRRAYLRSLDQILLATLPGMAAALVMADLLVPFVMGERWQPVVPLFRWLGLAGLHLPLTATLPWLLTSQGRTRELAQVAVFGAATSVAGFVAGLPFGAAGVAMIYGLGDLGVRAPLSLWYVGRRGPVSARYLVGAAAPHVAGTALAALAIATVRWLLPLPTVPALLVGAAIGYGVAWSVVALSPERRRALAEMGQLGARLLAAPLARRAA